MRRILLAATGWLLAAAVAGGVGTLAVSLVGSGITAEENQVLSQQAARQALAHAEKSESNAPATTTTQSPSTHPSAPATPSTTGPERVRRALGTQGGSVIAQCTGSTVYLLSWTPEQGFEAEDQVRGPAHTAYVKFDSDELEVHLNVSCVDGVPNSTVRTEADD